MVARKTAWALAGGLVFVSTLAAFQLPWRVYQSLEGYDNVPVAQRIIRTRPNGSLPAADLIRCIRNARFSRRGFGFGGGDWTEGGTS